MGFIELHVYLPWFFIVGFTVLWGTIVLSSFGPPWRAFKEQAGEDNTRDNTRKQSKIFTNKIYSDGSIRL